MAHDVGLTDYEKTELGVSIPGTLSGRLPNDVLTRDLGSKPRVSLHALEA